MNKRFVAIKVIVIAFALVAISHGFKANADGCLPVGGACPASTCCLICDPATGNATDFVNNCDSGKTPELNAAGDNCSCRSAPEKLATFFNIINSILLPISVILGLFLIMLAGYKIMSSQGDPTKLNQGKEGLTSAIIGLLFVLMAVSILRVIIKALISGYGPSPF
jgi:hypothetical protein